jgi:hypothetical protein
LLFLELVPTIGTSVLIGRHGGANYTNCVPFRCQ